MAEEKIHKSTSSDGSRGALCKLRWLKLRWQSCTLSCVTVAELLLSSCLLVYSTFLKLPQILGQCHQSHSAVLTIIIVFKYDFIFKMERGVTRKFDENGDGREHFTGLRL